MFPKVIKLILSLISLGYAIYQFTDNYIGNGVLFVILSGMFILVYFKNEIIFLSFLRLRKQDFVGTEKWLNRIPNMPNCIECIISNNRISVLPHLPNVEFLNCQYNYIEQIECLPHCHFLVCQHNYIHCIQNLPECVSLYANHNCLSVINVPSCSTLVVDNNLLEHIVESCHYEKVSLHHNPLKRLPKGNYTLMRELNNYERKDDNICIVDNHQLYYTIA